MKKNKNIREELEELSPFLAKLKKEEKNPFATPDQYFQQMQEELLHKIQAEEQPVTSPVQQPGLIDQLVAYIQWLLQPKYAVAMATFLVLIIAGIYYNTNSSATSDPLMAISTEDASQYIDSHMDEFELDLLVEALGDEIDDGMVPAPQLETEELEEYLDGIIDEIDIEDLEELL